MIEMNVGSQGTQWIPLFVCYASLLIIIIIIIIRIIRIIRIRSKSFVARVPLQTSYLVGEGDTSSHYFSVEVFDRCSWTFVGIGGKYGHLQFLKCGCVLLAIACHV